MECTGSVCGRCVEGSADDGDVEFGVGSCQALRDGEVGVGCDSCKWDLGIYCISLYSQTFGLFEDVVMS